MTLRVLVACERSGTVRRAFAAHGHDAWSCDLESADDGSPNHIQGDALAALRDRWDIAITHPPCTALASSGMHWTARGLRDPKLTEDAVDFVFAIIDAARHIPHLCIENPIGILSNRLRKPDQIVQPYDFGDDASKATCLWLRGLPPLRPTGYVEPRWVCCGIPLPEGVGRQACANCLGERKPMPRWGNQTDSGQNRLPPTPDRAKIRSQTYPGIARAMAQQWGAVAARVAA